MPEELLFDKSLHNITFIFRLTGLNIENKKRNYKQNCIFLFNLLWHETDVICALLWAIYGIFSGESFTEVTHIVPCVIFGILADVKAICLLIKEDKVYILINNLRDSETKSKDFVNIERNSLIQPDFKRLNNIIKALNIINSLMFVVFDGFPLLFIALKYLTTGKLELLLPFLDVYPFDSFDPRYWPFVYIHQFWSACIALLNVCAIDYFFFTCCTHIRIQFKLLQHQFQEIIANRSISAVVSINQMSIRAQFKDLIKWHQNIISCANMLEEIYSKSTLFNFLASSLMICLTGFNVTTVDDKAIVVTFIIFLSMSMMQVYFLCFFGDLLMSSSAAVANAVYNSRFYLGNVVMGKIVLLVQTRAQKPCKLTAAGFADVNLKAYMRILSTSWSYFALLQTIYSSRC
ncbi:hypothetical protein ABMA28_010223 [Loxostege sticticalis]|uniref:Odorant receptor n=1 Tax=Loxostege sticticalis TaxID=481309 RepID=A0ABD0SA46_LOXSC